MKCSFFAQISRVRDVCLFVWYQLMTESSVGGISPAVPLHRRFTRIAPALTSPPAAAASADARSPRAVSSSAKKPPASASTRKKSAAAVPVLPVATVAQDNRGRRHRVQENSQSSFSLQIEPQGKTLTVKGWCRSGISGHCILKSCSLHFLMLTGQCFWIMSKIGTVVRDDMYKKRKTFSVAARNFSVARGFSLPDSLSFLDVWVYVDFYAFVHPIDAAGGITIMLWVLVHLWEHKCIQQTYVHTCICACPGRCIILLAWHRLLVLYCSLSHWLMMFDVQQHCHLWTALAAQGGRYGDEPLLWGTHW